MKSNQIVSRHLEANFMCWLLYFWPCVSQLLPNPGVRPQSVRQITKMTARLKLECRSDFVDWLYLSWSLTEQPQYVSFARKAAPRYVFSPGWGRFRRATFWAHLGLAPTQKGRETKRPSPGTRLKTFLQIVNPPELTVSSCTSTPCANAADGPLPAERTDNCLSRWRL